VIIPRLRPISRTGTLEKHRWGTGEGLGPAKVIKSAGRRWVEDATLTQICPQYLTNCPARRTDHNWVRAGGEIDRGCARRIASDKREAPRRV
jgi:hypothetical protein